MRKCIHGGDRPSGPTAEHSPPQTLPGLPHISPAQVALSQAGAGTASTGHPTNHKPRSTTLHQHTSYSTNTNQHCHNNNPLQCLTNTSNHNSNLPTTTRPALAPNHSYIGNHLPARQPTRFPMALRLGHRPMAPLTLARQRDTARCRPAHRNKKLPPPTPDLSAAAGIPATDQATTQDTDTTRQRDHPQATTNTSAPQAQHPGEQQAAQPDEEPQQRTEADAGHCSQRVANKNRQVGMETSPCTDRATKPRRPWVGLPGYLYRQRDRPAGAVHPTHHSTRRQPAEHPTNITDRTCHSTTDGRPTPANNQHTRCRAFKHAKHTPTAGGRHQPRPTTPSHTHTHTRTHTAGKVWKRSSWRSDDWPPTPHKSRSQEQQTTP